MLISHEYKFLYYGPPKTGTTTINLALSRLCGQCHLSSIGGKHSYEWIPQEHPDDYETYFMFMSAKNPFARLVSLWDYQYNLDDPTWSDTQPKRLLLQHELRKVGSFKGYVFQMRHAWAGWRMLNTHNAMPHVDQTIHTETLLEDMNSLPFVQTPWPALGTPQKVGDYHGSPTGRAWYHYYTPAIVEEVLQHWGEDFVHFGYSTELDDAIDPAKRGGLLTAISNKRSGLPAND